MSNSLDYCVWKSCLLENDLVLSSDFLRSAPEVFAAEDLVATDASLLDRSNFFDPSLVFLIPVRCLVEVFRRAGHLNYKWYIIDRAQNVPSDLISPSHKVWFIPRQLWCHLYQRSRDGHSSPYNPPNPNPSFPKCRHHHLRYLMSEMASIFSMVWVLTLYSSHQKWQEGKEDGTGKHIWSLDLEKSLGGLDIWEIHNESKYWENSLRI